MWAGACAQDSAVELENDSGVSPDAAGPALCALLERHPVVILVAETGTGKSTKVPAFLWKQGGFNWIACTQPRRLAAMALASRVATELGVKLGCEVGYSVRFADQTTPGLTHIKYVTDGWMLRAFVRDPLASAYDLVMVDDAHERSLATDLLLALFRRLLWQQDATANPTSNNPRKLPRLVVSSATLNADQFSAFFGGAPVLRIVGRRYPVRIAYAISMPEDYVLAAVSQVMQVFGEWCESKHNQRDRIVDGMDVLVFLTGQEEIERAAQLMKHQAQQTLACSPATTMTTTSKIHRSGGASDASATNKSSCSDEETSMTQPGLGVDSLNRAASQPRVLTVALYGALPSSEQVRICCERPPPGTLRVILATNVAETSLTLPNVRVVIDSGYVKQRIYDHLEVVPASQAAAEQRAGRAGRSSPGVCYRLYTREFYSEQMAPELIPEIKRVDLSDAFLLLKRMGIDRLDEIVWLDPPDTANVRRSLRLLRRLGALTTVAEAETEAAAERTGSQDTENSAVAPPAALSDRKLQSCSSAREVLSVPLGQRMADMPLEARLARALLAAEELGCTRELLSAVAILSTGYPLLTRRGLAEAVPRFCRTKPNQLRDPLAYNDFLLFARVFDAWKAASDATLWCYRLGISERVLRLAESICKQLSVYLRQPLASRPEALAAALYTAFADQTARLTSRGTYVHERPDDDDDPVVVQAAAVASEQRCRLQRTPLRLHPSSCVHGREWAPPRLLFYELLIAKQPFMRCVCALTASDCMPQQSASVSQQPQSRAATAHAPLSPQALQRSSSERRARWSGAALEAVPTRSAVEARSVRKRSRWDKVN